MYISLEITEINFWALALSSSKAFYWKTNNCLNINLLQMSKNRPPSAGPSGGGDAGSLGLLKDLKKIQTSLRKDDISWDCWRQLRSRMRHVGFLTSEWSVSSSEETSSHGASRQEGSDDLDGFYPIYSK